MNNLFRSFFQKPIAIVMIFIFFGGLGIIGVSRTRVKLMPDITYPGISINVSFPGESAERVESEVAIPFERQLNTVSGVQSINTTASENKAKIDISFELGLDMDMKFLEVREQVKRVEGDLPEGVRRVQIRKFSSQDMPVLITAFTSDSLAPEQIRTSIEERLESSLQRLEGTADVRVVGGREEKILVNIMPARLRAYNLSLSQVSSVLSRATVTRPLANLREGSREIPLRQGQLPANPRDLGKLPVNSGPRGLVSLNEVAEVKRGYLPKQTISRVNGEPSVAVYLFKNTDANLLDLSQKARSLIGNTELENIQSHNVFDQADPVEKSLASLQNSVLIGAIAAIIVLYLFMKKRGPVIIISLVIPVSVLIVLLLLYISPYTLNVITMGGIALGIGMLVDSAIVVLENIKRVHQKEDDLFNSLVLGTSQMVPSLIASVLTTIIVFLPLLFLDARIQTMYAGFAFTVSAGLLSSLLASALLVPILIMWIPGGEQSVSDRMFAQEYRTVLGSFMEHKKIVLLILGLFIFSGFLAYLQLGEAVGTSFGTRNLTLEVELTPGTPLQVTRRRVSGLEDILARKPYIQNFTTEVENWSGSINIQLVPQSIHPLSTANARDDIRENLQAFRKRGGQAYFQGGGSGSGQMISLELAGPEILKLEELSQEYLEKLTELEELADLRIVLPRSRPAYTILFSWKKLAEYGFDLRSVLEELRATVGGQISARLRDESRQFEVILRLRENQLDKPEDLKNVPLSPPGGSGSIWLSELVRFERRMVSGQIQRKDGRRAAFLVGEIQSSDIAGTFKKINSAVKDLPLPDNYFFDFGESYEKLMEMRQGMTWVIMVTVTLIYLVLMGVLESIWKPFLIMLSVPAAMAGSVWGLYMAEIVLSLPVYIGLIMLMGIVVNSSVVLVVRMSAHLPEFDSPVSATVAGALERIKPILMTNSTTVIAIFPLLFSQESGSALSFPMALTVITGLVCGVIFNLLFLPVIFCSIEMGKNYFRNKIQQAV